MPTCSQEIEMPGLKLKHRLALAMLATLASLAWMSLLVIAPALAA